LALNNVAPPARALDESLESTDVTLGFHVSVATSNCQDIGDAMRELGQKMQLRNRGAPDFVALHYSCKRDAESLRNNALLTFGNGALHGGSSCLGVMSQEGALLGGHGPIGAFAIWDDQGAYGTALVPLAEDPRSAAAKAMRLAQERAGRPGEAPDLVWLTSAPGHEEAVLMGIKDVVGPAVLIVGGSAADDTVEGAWTQLSSDATDGNAVAVSAIFSSQPVNASFHGAYAPTAFSGKVTEANGRHLIAIDGRPAAQVYAEWTAGLIEIPEQGSAFILSQTSLHPLARQDGHIAGIPYYLTLHPAFVHSDGRLEMFADIHIGETLTLMLGSHESLIERAANVAAASRGRRGMSEVSGALMVYCGGCMLNIKDKMDIVAESVADALSAAPFLGLFSFGEQGEVVSGGTKHANLMISCIAFGGPNKEPDGPTDNSFERN
jgi:hypothetical protein